MAETLSQEEIDQLLSAMNSEEIAPAPFTDVARAIKAHLPGRGRRMIKDFEKFLTERKFQAEKPYGLFDKDVAVSRFFDGKDNEPLLKKIRQKNKKQGMGNITIPNTSIELLNYSICPKCGEVFSFAELLDYYKNPVPDKHFKSKAEQYREDTRVCCPKCKTYFLPDLLIIDGTPKNETQFLCRVQTIHAIESFYKSQQQKVLTQNGVNILSKDNHRAIRNDACLADLEQKPTLIVNLLQYTPPNLMPNLIDGSNIEKGDVIFGQWFPNPEYNTWLA
jgi:hypothetical protein